MSCKEGRKAPWKCWFPAKRLSNRLFCSDTHPRPGYLTDISIHYLFCLKYKSTVLIDLCHRVSLLSYWIWVWSLKIFGKKFLDILTTGMAKLFHITYYRFFKTFKNSWSKTIKQIILIPMALVYSQSNIIAFYQNSLLHVAN